MEIPAICCGGVTLRSRPQLVGVDWHDWHTCFRHCLPLYCYSRFSPKACVPKDDYHDKFTTAEKLAVRSALKAFAE